MFLVRAGSADVVEGIEKDTLESHIPGMSICASWSIYVWYDLVYVEEQPYIIHVLTYETGVAELLSIYIRYSRHSADI